MWVISNHLKLCLATATHNFNWLKMYISNIQLSQWVLLQLHPTRLCSLVWVLRSVFFVVALCIIPPNNLINGVSMPAWLLFQTGRDRLLRPSGAMSWAIIAQKHCYGQRRENIIYQFGCFGVRSTVVYVTNPLTNYTLQRSRTTKINNSNCLLESNQLLLFAFGGKYPHHLQD